MSKINVEVEGLSKAKELFRNFPKVVHENIKGINIDIARRIQQRARDKVAVDLGNLREDIQIRDENLSVAIFNSEVYAPAIEFGLPPNTVFPPPDALAGWAARHGMAGAEWAIALNIFRRGTKPQPYLKPAYFEVKDDYKNEIKIMLQGLGGD